MMVYIYIFKILVFFFWSQKLCADLFTCQTQLITLIINLITLSLNEFLDDKVTEKTPRADTHCRLFNIFMIIHFFN